MHDTQVRIALRQELESRLLKRGNTVIFEEFAVKHGQARIDLAVIGESIHGYEIKGDMDSLKRLPGQARIYSTIFDRVTLVVGYRHAYKALQIVPVWWGVKLVQMDARGKIRFNAARLPSNNPWQDKISILRLLWKVEAIEFLNEIDGAVNYRNKSRNLIYERIAQMADIETIKTRVKQEIMKRTDWKSGVQRMLNGG